MKKFFCIILAVFFFFALFGCSANTDPYTKMNEYLDRNGWSDWDLLDYVDYQGLLYLPDLVSADYITVDDMMDHLVGMELLSEYGYVKADTPDEPYDSSAEYEATEYRHILQEIAYLTFSYEDGVSKSEIFDQIYDIIAGCTDTMGDVILP